MKIESKILERRKSLESCSKEIQALITEIRTTSFLENKALFCEGYAEKFRLIVEREFSFLMLSPRNFKLASMI